MKKLVESGAIGTVRAVVSRQFARLAEPAPDSPTAWRVNPAQSGGGIFFEGACHTFDFLDFMFGPIVDVRAIAANQAHAYVPEDTVVATYRFDSGVLGTGFWCYAADHDFEMNEIVGSAGRIQFSTSQPVPIRLLRGSSVEEYPVSDPPHVHQPLIQTIVDELNGQGRCPSTGATAARTAWVMEEILADFRTGVA